MYGFRKKEALRRLIGVAVSVVASVAASVVLLLALVACGTSGESANTDTNTDAGANANASTGGASEGDEAQPATEPLTVNVACRNDYQEIWDAVNEELVDDNIKVVNTAYDTSVNLNELLIEGDIEMNVAQHYAALEYVKTSDPKFEPLTSIGEIHISTLDLYSNKYASLDELPDGAVIAIPNDFMNGGRALNVLATSGLITLSADAPSLPTAEDIADNPKGFIFQDISSDMMVRVLDDVDAGFVYSVNAVDGGLDPRTDAIYNDNIDFAQNPNEKQFIIIFTVRAEDLDNPTFKKIVDAYHSVRVQETYRDVYGVSLIPVIDGKAIDVTKL
jgi:D-methionine transport system substrate-binding protein